MKEHKQTERHSAIFWNALGGAAFAGQSAVILIFVSNRLGMEAAGIVTIAYAVANLFYAVAQYGVRNFQVTDVEGKYAFKDYLAARVITVLTAIAMLALYLWYICCIKGDSVEKAMITFEVTIWKQVDALEDVFVGQYQQVGRLDIGAKIMASRLIISTGLVCLLIFLSVDIKVSFAVGIVLSAVMDVAGIWHSFYIVQEEKQLVSAKKIVGILMECFPLCVGTTFASYTGNAPKYLIDSYMDEQMQAVFGYIMLPVFAVMLLNNFIYQPVVKGMGDLWEQKRLSEFWKKVVRQCEIIVLLTVVVTFVGIWIGIPALSALYYVNLKPYEKEFIVLLLGGGFYAMAVYLNVPLTAMRKQRIIAGGYLAVSLLSIMFGRFFILYGKMMGAAAIYLTSSAILSAGYLLVVFFEAGSFSCLF